MFYDTAVSFLESPWVLGRYCGPSGDVGPEMAAKLLKSNRRIVAQSKLRALTETELNSPEENTKRGAFDVAVKEKLVN